MLEYLTLPVTKSNEVASLLHEFITHNQFFALSWGSYGTEVRIWLLQAEARGSVSIERGPATARMMDSVLLHTDLAASILHSRLKDKTPAIRETPRKAVAVGMVVEDPVAVDGEDCRPRIR